jgi:hypothetical protein
MTEPRKITVVLPDGRQGQGIEIPIDISKERWSEYTLEDGSVFRAKLNVVSVVRVENEYDAQGIPIYQVNSGPALAFTEVPEHLKKGKQQ